MTPALSWAEIALEEVTVTNTAQRDTNELMDWVFGPEVEDTGSEDSITASSHIVISSILR